jgi:hypothetical protein
VSHQPKSKLVKRNTSDKAAKVPPFDPAAFLATAGVGRAISAYSKKEVPFRSRR